jgi:hypothetical protein
MSDTPNRLTLFVEQYVAKTNSFGSQIELSTDNAIQEKGNDDNMIECNLPDAILLLLQSNSMFIINELDGGGIIDESRRQEFENRFSIHGFNTKYVTLMDSKKQISQDMNDFPWGTSFWFAEDPEHLMEFI